ncbi:hypothetical protein TNCV_4062451 [Trichonephila clavipes]|nr:hypothetical protein TNCV_4062451 [Trichonephila clavipes]
MKEGLIASSYEYPKCNDRHDVTWSAIKRFLRNRTSHAKGSFAMRGKGDNRLVPGPNYMVDALKLRNQAPRASGESLQKYVAWRCPDGTQHLFG